MTATVRRGEDSEDMEKERERVQLELLRVLHAEGEARTRREDSTPKKLLDSAVPFVVGILIGVLATLSALTGRLSAVEAVQSQQTVVQGQQAAELREMRAALTELPALRAALTELLAITRSSNSSRGR